MRAQRDEDPFHLIGSVVDGRYRIECVAGEGGFGVVYRAFHLGFAARIALKVLKLPGHWSDSRREARIVSFQREGRMLFELSRLHPSIVRAFETGTIWDGKARAPYLSLEWLDGVSLDQELRHRRRRGLPPFELQEVLSLLEASAAGLERAHALGVAHRDIKPGNLFIDRGGKEPQVKILDSGIAKLDETAENSHLGHALAGLSGASFTPMYAAPEQWLTRLGPTGPWTDVHALALVCTELLTGRAPFSGADATQFQAACLDATARPTPAALGVRLSESVESVLARAVALEPRERYQHVGAFWEALCAAARWSPSSGAIRIAALVPEPSPDRNGARDAAPSALSAPVQPRATSVTRSRVRSDVQRLASKRRRISLGARLVMSAGIAVLAAVALVDRGSRALLFGRTPSPDIAGRRAQSSDRTVSSTALLTAMSAPQPAISGLPLEAREGPTVLGASEQPSKVPTATPRRHHINAALSNRSAPLRSADGSLPQAAQLEVNLDDPGLTRRK